MSASPFILLPVHYHNDDATLLNAGAIWFYVSGSGDTVLAPVYTDHTGLVEGSNPVILNARGEPPTEGIYLNDSVVYKVILKRANGTTIKSIDGYKPKLNGSDGTDGADGTRGSLWFSSPNNPASTSGCITEDRFQNTVTGDVFRFNGVSWVLNCNIKGANGADGTNGTSNATQVQGGWHEPTILGTLATPGWGVDKFSNPDWNSYTGIFIASVASKYMVNVTADICPIHDPLSEVISSCILYIVKNGTVYTELNEVEQIAVGSLGIFEQKNLSGTCVIDMEIGDTIYISSNSQQVDILRLDLAIASIGGVKGDKGDTGYFTASYPLQLSEDEVPELTILPATTLLPGYMSASDKVKLNAITGTNTGDETETTIKTKLNHLEYVYPWDNSATKYLPVATITIDTETGSSNYNACAEFNFMIRGGLFGADMYNGTIIIAMDGGSAYPIIKDVYGNVSSIVITQFFAQTKVVSPGIIRLYLSNDPYVSYAITDDVTLTLSKDTRCSVVFDVSPAWTSTSPSASSGQLVSTYSGLAQYFGGDLTVGGRFSAGTQIKAPPSTSGLSGVNIGAYGTAPTTPIDGDVYKTSSSVLKILMGAVANTFAFLESAQTWTQKQIINLAGAGMIFDFQNAGVSKLSGSDTAVTASVPVTISTGAASSKLNLTSNAGTTSSINFKGGLSNGASNIGKTVSTTDKFWVYTDNNAGITLGANAATVDFTSTSFTMSVPIVHATPSASLESCIIPHGAAPTTPSNGSIWTTTAGMNVRINGVTKTITLT